ncbi:MAG: hypothetical protein LBB74_10040 [Chitinispirillales bacterium]|jgi:hypothetical protein|nr:hypothetical protein [Chitinispirillales bacterium]
MLNDGILEGDIVFSTITLQDGREVRAVMTCESGSGTAATQIMPKASPYVRNAKSAVIQNKDGKNTEQVIFAIPAFLSGAELTWDSTEEGSTTYINQKIGPDGKLNNKISHSASRFKRGGDGRRAG